MSIKGWLTFMRHAHLLNGERYPSEQVSVHQRGEVSLRADIMAIEAQGAPSFSFVSLAFPSLSLALTLGWLHNSERGFAALLAFPSLLLTFCFPFTEVSFPFA
jgi:hypothetical protein